jgi:WhiB family redox-sensing transcriptional regulator
MHADWMGQGRCKDMDPALFFPSDWTGVQYAQRICVDCAVRRECLGYALAHRITDGVWGGTSERQRMRLLRSEARRARFADLGDGEPAGRH